MCDEPLIYNHRERELVYKNIMYVLINNKNTKTQKQ